MTTTPRQKAERCFAVARSTTHEGERDNAISRGLAICERAHLDPDDFDIPGRAKTKAPPPHSSRFRDDLYERPRAPKYSTFDQSTVNDAMRNFAEEIAKARNDRLKEAIREAVERSAREAQERLKRQVERDREREAAAEKRRLVDVAVNELWLAGCRVYLHSDPGELKPRVWFVVTDEGAGEVTDGNLIELATRVREKGKPAADWQFG